MTCSFVVSIDESGDEGFATGSSEWFVLSAVVTRKCNDLEAVKLVDRVRTLLGRPPRSPCISEICGTSTVCLLWTRSLALPCGQ